MSVSAVAARDDVARRMDCRLLAQLVAEHQTDEDEASELAWGLARKTCKL